MQAGRNLFGLSAEAKAKSDKEAADKKAKEDKEAAEKKAKEDAEAKGDFETRDV